MENNELNQVTRIYFTDTNCFRYPANITNEDQTKEMELRRQHKKAVKRFWDKAAGEIAAKESVIMINSEVAQELKIQSHTLTKKETKVIQMLQR
ncbi:hypothetical protein [Bacillus sp. V59.32b]|uniref:hypothetical protein n=1 Tax=Bacillus sp. V59.32b TaxID=1758642 RepID=UPI000E3CFD0B|nr:hypothetical protein [Bacillus sp. V59.32b]RFU61501.1 hypothetical protein D0463_14975 [Bacillus sp. V59.32b]